MTPMPEHNLEMESPRLLIQSINNEFIHQIFREKSKEEIMNYMGLDENSYQRYLEMHQQGMKSFRHSHSIFLLRNKSSQICMGEAGFHTWNSFHCRAELFYTLRQEAHRNKGFMSEALPYILNHGFKTMALNRVQALLASDNIPSLKLLQKFFFRFEGLNRQDFRVEGKFEDSLQYSLLAEDWLKQTQNL